MCSYHYSVYYYYICSSLSLSIPSAILSKALGYNIMVLEVSGLKSKLHIYYGCTRCHYYRKKGKVKRKFAIFKLTFSPPVNKLCLFLTHIHMYMCSLYLPLCTFYLSNMTGPLCVSLDSSVSVMCSGRWC